MNEPATNEKELTSLATEASIAMLEVLRSQSFHDAGLQHSTTLVFLTKSKYDLRECAMLVMPF